MNIDDLNQVRVVFFLSGLILFTVCGYLFPWRKLKSFDLFRQVNNILLVFLNSFFVKVIFGTSAIVLINHLEVNEFGIFNIIKLPYVIEFILTIVLMDLIIYFQHRIFHTNKYLWKLHRVHHSDISYDATTALRFHSIEIILSIVIKLFSIAILGASLVPFIAFEIILNFSAMFNHGNYSFGKLEKILGYVIVTPDIHRIHHTDVKVEINSNYGFFLSIWDRLFRTFTKKSKYEKNSMIIGLGQFNKKEDQRIDRLLIQPFK